MVVQEDFGVEKFMDKYEVGIKFNLGETCVDSISISELDKLCTASCTNLLETIFNAKLTYGHIHGSSELKRKIADLYNNINNHKFPEKLTDADVVITNGAIGANFLTLYAFLEPKDQVLVVDPTYQQLESVSNVFSGNVTPFKLHFENQYLPDLTLLEKQIKQNKTKLLIINNPNNPTGVVWDNALLKQVIEICKRNDTWILSDEVYRPLYHSTDAVNSIVNFGYEKTVSTGSMSKAFSSAGIRLGWIVTKNLELLKNILTKRDYNIISISKIDDMIASYILTNYKRLLERNYEICRKNIRLIENFINNSKGLLSWVKPQGGSTCFVKINGVDTFKMATELAEQSSTLCVPGEAFNGASGFLRLGYGNSTEDVEGGLKNIKEWLSKNGYWR